MRTSSVTWDAAASRATWAFVYIVFSFLRGGCKKKSGAARTAPLSVVLVDDFPCDRVVGEAAVGSSHLGQLRCSCAFLVSGEFCAPVVGAPRVGYETATLDGAAAVGKQRLGPLDLVGIYPLVDRVVLRVRDDLILGDRVVRGLDSDKQDAFRGRRHEGCYIPQQVLIVVAQQVFVRVAQQVFCLSRGIRHFDVTQQVVLFLLVRAVTGEPVFRGHHGEPGRAFLFGRVDGEGALLDELVECDSGLLLVLVEGLRCGLVDNIIKPCSLRKVDAVEDSCLVVRELRGHFGSFFRFVELAWSPVVLRPYYYQAPQ